MVAGEETIPLCTSDINTERSISIFKLKRSKDAPTDDVCLQPLVGNDRSEKDPEKKATEFTDDPSDGITQTTSLSLFRKSSRRKKAIFLLLGLVNLASTGCFALLAPFFPREAAEKGMSATITGLVFSCFQFWIFVSAPVFGHFMTQVGPRFVFIAGQFLSGGCTVLFGVLYLSPPGAIFTVQCFALRTVQALGSSAFSTASFTLIANEFPDKVAIVFGSLEMFNGLGLIVGPALGGALYQVGGFGLPFFLIGSFLLLCCGATFFLLPSSKESKDVPKSGGSIFRLLTSPLILASTITVLAGSYTICFFDASMALHLYLQFGVQPGFVGLLFTVYSVMYSLASPVFGWLINKFHSIDIPVMIVGDLLMCISLLMIGPSPLLTFIETNMVMFTISLVVLGMGFAATLVPAVKTFYTGARELGLDVNLDLDAKVSGLLNFAIHLGMFLGPTTGNAIYEVYGYGWSTTFSAALCLIGALSLQAYVIAQRCCQRGPKYEKQVNFNEF